MGASKGSDSTCSGYVFNIQRYTLHDGPGIRTLVFLNGCPLRCRWCSNPESQSSRPELALKLSQCIGTVECGVCLPACASGAITSADDSKIRISRDQCQLCMNCTAVCPSQALHPLGSLRTVDEVMAVVEADEVFYGRSGGGMTLSGGEPLQQNAFALELLREAKRRRIGTAIETCGHVGWNVLSDAASLSDTIFFDIKCAKAAKHREFTGVDNALIIGNLRNLVTVFPQESVVVRTPLIPGFNDSVEDIADIIELLTELPAVTYEVLPYHRLGTPKYTYLGRDYLLRDATLNPATENAVKELVKQYADSRRAR